MTTENFFEQFSQLRETILTRIEDRKFEQELEEQGIDPKNYNRDVKVEVQETEAQKELYYERFEQKPQMMSKEKLQE